MGCLLALVALMSPRFALILVWLFSDQVSVAFSGNFVPFLGLIFLPWTTLAWTLLYQPVHGVTGFGWFLVIFAFVVDLASYGSGERQRRQRYVIV